jgi:hygromycin-B 4-O-kinase
LSERGEPTTSGQDETAVRVQTLLRVQFDGTVEALESLAGGEFSRAFAFVAGGQSYVVRYSPHPHAVEAFAKDDYAWRHFASPALPIPHIVAVGQVEDGAFAIAERIAGRRVEELSPTERAALTSSLLDTVAAIAGADVGESRGYGRWDGAGNGEAPTWRGYLAAVIDNKDEGYYRDWHVLFRDSFLEREVYEAVYRRMLQFAAHCPEERALIHGDLHFDNILTDGDRVTGVIDWGNAGYGDPLYDVAWLGRWNTYSRGSILDPSLLRARYGALPNYAARIACYECFLGLDDLRFYAKTNRRAEYQAMRDWLIAHHL